MSLRLSDYRDRHRGERCFVVGNGPSLRDTDLTGLRGQRTFTCNRGALAWPLLGGPSDYWTVEDFLDASQFAGEFRRLKGTVKFVPEDLTEYGFGPCVPVPFARDRFDERGESPPFGADGDPFYWGATVSYLMLQLCAYMGFAEAVLLGHDFRYDTSCVQETADGVWIQRGADRNHFAEGYWPAGARAFAARPEHMRRAFQSAQAWPGLSIVNATPGTALDVFPCEDLPEVLRRPVCAPTAATT